MNSEFETVYNVVTDVSLKPQWVKGLKSVTEENALSRIGGIHECILPNQNITFETAEQVKENGFATYTEKTDSLKWLSPLIVSFNMTKKEHHVDLQVNVHYKKNGVLSNLLDLPIRLLTKVTMRSSLKRLKRFIETTG